VPAGGPHRIVPQNRVPRSGVRPCALLPNHCIQSCTVMAGAETDAEAHRKVSLLAGELVANYL